LVVGRMEDFVSWNYTKTGIFTVWSAYCTKWNHQHGRKLLRTNAQGTAESNPVWIKLWSLKVSPKVNFFRWRLLHGTIPCNPILANRHIIMSSLCLVCEFIVKILSTLYSNVLRVCGIWEHLGLLSQVEEMVSVDRAGSGVLEALLIQPDCRAQLFPEVGTKELILTTC
jgi:hypothetical protein